MEKGKKRVKVSILDFQFDKKDLTSVFKLEFKDEKDKRIGRLKIHVSHDFDKGKVECKVLENPDKIDDEQLSELLEIFIKGIFSKGSFEQLLKKFPFN